MHLLTGFYVDKSTARTREFLECIRRNAAQPAISRVVIFIEDKLEVSKAVKTFPVLLHEKIELVAHGRRLRFSDLFTYANEHCVGGTVAIANADIFFDDSLSLVRDYSLKGLFLALSRWDERGSASPVHFERDDSQDAWIFRAPIGPLAVPFHLGVPGCDNRLAHEAARAGLRVLNPSRSIRARHLHQSRVRRYHTRDRLDGEMLRVPCTTLAQAGLASAPRSAKRSSPRSRAPRFELLEDFESVVKEATGTQLSEPLWNEVRLAFEREQSRKDQQLESELTKLPFLALTSLSPDPTQFRTQQQSISSWRAAGLHVVSFNHRSEFAALRDYEGVDLVAVERTSKATFGKHYVPISEICEFASRCEGYVLLINADILLQCEPWTLRRAALSSDTGLCYLIRHNHTGDLRHATAEPYGIDGFLFHPRHSHLIKPSFLSMGQPFWDYWLPHVFSEAGLPIFTLEEPVAFHEEHALRWSEENWHKCALEFERLTSLLGQDRSLKACTTMALQVRNSFDSNRTILERTPPAIRDWVENKFRDGDHKTFFELGAHQGTDTQWLAALPGVVVHAFEPDPRNHPPHLPNVRLVRAAVSDVSGRAPLFPSVQNSGKEWTYSSSIQRPTNHLERYPVTFGEPIEVATIALDDYAREHGIDSVDFIWADIQGAERKLILGAKQLLARTRYLYTEYSDEELYAGQPTLSEILSLLPEFRVLQLYPEDVLLENTSMRG